MLEESAVQPQNTFETISGADLYRHMAMPQALDVSKELRHQARRARRLAFASSLSEADTRRLLAYAEELENRAAAEEAARNGRASRTGPI
jgi:hypothetical protein